MTGIFVTGTDTGVGKTLVAAALARLLRLQGVDVGVLKPVETGVEDPGRPGPDAALLHWAAGSDDPPEILAPYRFRRPLAPSVAADREGTRIDPSLLLERFKAAARPGRFLIVEGAGGLMVPLAGGILICDLVRSLQLPLLVVARPGLGTINHTLLTVFAARSQDLPVAGVLLNGMPAEPDEAERSAPHAIASLASADLLGVLPRVEGEDRHKVEKLSRALAELPTLNGLLSALGLDPGPGGGFRDLAP